MYGVPQMMQWIQSANVKSAAEFYAEGLGYARQEAVRRDAATRLVIHNPDTNGWLVQTCQPTTQIPCDANATWTDVLSRSGSAFDNIVVTVCPNTTQEVDFTPLGWVNTVVTTTQMNAIRLDAPSGSTRSTQVEINLSGVVSKCDPAVTGSTTDSRRCQWTCS
jgi:type IV fimbrial biogenesis protein FimT